MTKLIVGVNDLQTINPILAEEWDFSKNELKPNEVFSNQNIKVWWIGKCGHNWQSSISTRNALKCGCPYCSNKKILIGFNDLASKRPDLVEEFDYSKNGNLSPENIIYKSYTRVWWKCKKCNYEWQTRVVDRSDNNRNCPYCSNISRVDKHKKAIICTTTGVTFESVKKASEFYNISTSSISKVCTGKLEYASGYHFEFIDKKD
jgi:rubrerythrin